MRKMTSIFVAGSLLAGLAVASPAWTANYPHDTQGKKFPAFMHDPEAMTSIQETPVTKTVVSELRSQDIRVNTKKRPVDNKGTNVRNVHTITVDMQENLLSPDESYNLVYFFNGKPVWQFSNVRLPYTFTRDYRGQRPGTHTIKIDIEDDEGNVLATQSSSIQVVR
ncbi:MAG: hypothetical protein K8I00_03705 [Candidatus Omnitrophica bacterium]|nr:hypothetical protein [Candidatus Omnitrophota bacterium]